MTGLYRGMRAIVAICTLGFVATCQAAGLGACKLISADQASKILGRKISAHAMDTSASGRNAGSMCRYAGKGIGSGFMLIAGHVDMVRSRYILRRNPRFPGTHRSATALI